MRASRPVLAVLLAASILIPAVSTGTVAWAKSSDRHAVTHPVKPDKPAVTHRVKPVFAAQGKVTAVDADARTVTVQAKGGTKNVKGHTVTVTVPSSVRIRLDGRRVTLSALRPGYRIIVTGRLVGGVYAASKVEANSPRRSPTPTTSPSTSPSASPSVSPSVTPTASPSVEPTTDPTTTPSADPSVSPTLV